MQETTSTYKALDHEVKRLKHLFQVLNSHVLLLISHSTKHYAVLCNARFHPTHLLQKSAFGLCLSALLNQDSRLYILWH